MDAIKTITSNVITHINNNYDDVVSEDELAKLVNIYSTMFDVNDDDKKKIIDEISSRLKVRMDVGSVIKKETHKPWYLNAKANNECKFWGRYRQYLITTKEFAPEAVNAIDRATDSIMDLLGDPNSKYNFSHFLFSI